MIKKAIHAVAWRSEKLLDLLRGPAKRNQADKRLIIEPYAGYATPAHLVVRGRVLTALRRNSPLPTQSRWLNFRQMLSLFLTDEVASVEVTAEGASAVTDEEGYFTAGGPIRRSECSLDVPFAAIKYDSPKHISLEVIVWNVRQNSAGERRAVAVGKAVLDAELPKRSS